MKIRKISNIILVLIFCTTFCNGRNTTRSSHQDENLEENMTSSITSRKSGQIRFEDSEISGPGEPDHGSSSSRFKFEDNGDSYDTSTYEENNAGRITFQDDNKINFERPSPDQYPHQSEIKVESSGTKKKKRRRRRPRYQRPPNGVGPFPGPQYPGGLPPVGLPYPGAPGVAPPYPGVPGAAPPYPGVPGVAPPYPVTPGSEPPYPGVSGVPPLYPGIPGPLPPYPGFGPGNTGQYYRPPRRRPKPSFASEALITVTSALSSIAQYDDYQCVPRLLCEAAGGAALGSSGVLQSVAGLQPLLTLLAAYNGISSSPLFVFGRAVFLGMTTKGNAASCRYAYPQCPTDPEQLVHYLNNHNGGFFRFFNSPQQNPQNLQQFYQQLSSQGQFGIPNLGSPNPFSQNLPENFGNPNPYPQNPPQNFGNLNPYPQNLDFYQQQNQQNFGQPQPNQQGYGLQQYPNGNQNHYGLYQPQLNQYPQQDYGLQNQQFQNGPPSLYSNNGYGYLQNYGKKYPYSNKYGFNNIKYKDKGDKTKIHRRIQNKPTYESTYDSDIENADFDQGFKFPNNQIMENEENNTRGGKVLKFPEENVNNNNYDLVNKRKLKAINSPPANRIQGVNNGYSNRITNAYLNYLNFSIRNTLLDNYFKYYSYYHGYPVTENLQNDNNNLNQGVTGNQQNLNNNFNNYVNNLNNYKNNLNDYNTYFNNYNNNLNQEEGLQTVYIVRGNGDPNNPEIVKIRPGEEVKL